VVGLVLIDPPSESSSPPPGWIMPASPWLARTGVLRAGRMLSSKADGLAGGGALRAFLNRPDHLSRASDEMLAWNSAVREMTDSRPADGVKVWNVDLGTRDRIAFLTNPAAVEAAIGAIKDAVAVAR
jgi:hypothetical protein